MLPALYPIIQFYLVLKSPDWVNYPVRTSFLITTSTLVCNYFYVLLPSSCKDFSVLDKLKRYVWVSVVVQAPIKKQSLVWKWRVWKSTRRKSQDDKIFVLSPYVQCFFKLISCPSSTTKARCVPNQFFNWVNWRQINKNGRLSGQMHFCRSTASW